MNDEATSRNLLQRDVASMLLSVIGDHGFALAGAGAIREHALTDRPTSDIDLFGPPLTMDQFAGTRARRCSAPVEGEIDAQAGELCGGPRPVLSERDAITGKLSAVYSRGDVRDFLDLDAIRSSGRITDNALLTLGAEHDDGFDQRIFAEQLSRATEFLPTKQRCMGSAATTSPRSNSDS